MRCLLLSSRSTNNRTINPVVEAGVEEEEEVFIPTLRRKTGSVVWTSWTIPATILVVVAVVALVLRWFLTARLNCIPAKEDTQHQSHHYHSRCRPQAPARDLDQRHSHLRPPNSIHNRRNSSSSSSSSGWEMPQHLLMGLGSQSSEGNSELPNSVAVTPSHSAKSNISNSSYDYYGDGVNAVNGSYDVNDGDVPLDYTPSAGNTPHAGDRGGSFHLSGDNMDFGSRQQQGQQYHRKHSQASFASSNMYLSSSTLGASVTERDEEKEEGREAVLPLPPFGNFARAEDQISPTPSMYVSNSMDSERDGGGGFRPGSHQYQHSIPGPQYQQEAFGNKRIIENPPPNQHHRPQQHQHHHYPGPSVSSSSPMNHQLQRIQEFTGTVDIAREPSLEEMEVHPFDESVDLSQKMARISEDIGGSAPRSSKHYPPGLRGYVDSNTAGRFSPSIPPSSFSSSSLPAGGGGGGGGLPALRPTNPVDSFYTAASIPSSQEEEGTPGTGSASSRTGSNREAVLLQDGLASLRHSASVLSSTAGNRGDSTEFGSEISTHGSLSQNSSVYSNTTPIQSPSSSFYLSTQHHQQQLHHQQQQQSTPSSTNSKRGSL
mmetsp:Transcript_13353/g.22237  ORF Transcript_13353/g.22237 Transcript_13353/m.22237 type:complete len:600 (+) Transcript_13353:14-1813(+)